MAQIEVNTAFPDLAPFLTALYTDNTKEGDKSWEKVKHFLRWVL